MSDDSKVLMFLIFGVVICLCVICMTAVSCDRQQNELTKICMTKATSALEARQCETERIRSR
jgi:hypothetical protein